MGYRQLKKSALSDKNKRLIREYLDYMFLTHRLSKPRLIKYLGTLRRIFLKIGKDFDKATEENLKLFIREIYSNDNYSPWTKRDFAITIKRFYKWYLGEDKRFPPLVEWINTTLKKKDTPRLKKSELLSEEDVRKLIRVADNPRDKAIVALAWDTGGRVGEFGTMRIDYINFVGLDTTVDFLKGKTGSRTCMTLYSMPYMAKWVDSHPLKEDKSAPLWINISQDPKRKHTQLTHRAIIKIFKRLMEKTDINKRIYCHLFRHSRATWCAENGWSQIEMCKYFGWEDDSRMPATYISMVSKDVNNRYKESYGIKSERQKKTEERKPIICHACDSINTAEATFCRNCNSVLNIKTAINILQKRKGLDEKLNKAMEGKGFYEAIKEKMIPELKEELKKEMGEEIKEEIKAELIKGIVSE